MAKTPQDAGERARDRRDGILRAACDLFYERGFAAVGVDEIGVRAGLSGPSIYRFFGGKDEILATLFDEAIDRLVECTAARLPDPRDELAALVRGHARFVLGDRRLAGVMFREERSLAGSHKARIRDREQRYAGRWVQCLRQCFPQRDDGELRRAALLAAGALNAIAAWPRDEAVEDSALDQVVAHVLTGLEALDGERSFRA